MLIAPTTRSLRTQSDDEDAEDDEDEEDEDDEDVAKKPTLGKRKTAPSRTQKPPRKGPEKKARRESPYVPSLSSYLAQCAYRRPSGRGGVRTRDGDSSPYEGDARKLVVVRDMPIPPGLGLLVFYWHQFLSHE